MQDNHAVVPVPPPFHVRQPCCTPYLQPVLTITGSGAWPSWEVLRSRNVEGEVRELLADARACYKRKGGVLAMQVRAGVG